MSHRSVFINVTTNAYFAPSPTFANFGGLQAVFAVTALLALAGIFVVGLLPKPNRQAAEARDEAAVFYRSRLTEVLSIKSLNTMYVSIFFLHFLLMAVFVVVPSGLEGEAGIARERHALAYLGALVLSVPGIYFLVQGRRYLSAPTHTLLLCLFVLLSGLVAMSLGGFIGTLLGLLLFFTALRRWKRCCPRWLPFMRQLLKGTAMGVFASSQFIGVFFGGMLGGALLDQAGVMGVWLGMSALTLVWATVLGVSHLASPDSVKVA